MSENLPKDRLSIMMVKTQDGDKAAYAELLEEAQRIVRQQLSKKKNLNQDLIEDITQEVLMSVHKARHTYRRQYPFLPWLLTIMNSRFIDYWRKKQKDAVSFYENPPEVPDTKGEVTQIEVDLLNQTISSLPETQRRAVKLLKIEGLSVKEVAQEMSMSESAVKVAAHRGYKRIQKEFGVSL